METFSDKIILLIVDKGLIAIIVILVGYFVNKTLETYKSKNSLVNDITKLRVDKISELTYKIAEFEQIVYEKKFKNLEIHIKKLLIEDFRKQTDDDIKKYRDKSDPQLIPELEKLFDRTKEKLENEISVIKEEMEKLDIEEGRIFDSVSLIYSKYRFWLGKELSEEFNSLMNGIISKMKGEFKEVDDIKEYQKQQKELDSKRIDVMKLLEKI